jgi:hypothetical protein
MPRKKGSTGYVPTSAHERILAALLVEAGEPISSVAARFGVKNAAGKEWLRSWRAGHDRFYLCEHGRDTCDGCLTDYETSAGYVWNGRGPERGPLWSPARVATAAHRLAADCFVVAIQTLRNNPMGIERSYRSLDIDAQAMFAPVWDLCRLAADELEAARAKLDHAHALADELRADLHPIEIISQDGGV